MIHPVRTHDAAGPDVYCFRFVLVFKTNLRRRRAWGNVEITYVSSRLFWSRGPPPTTRPFSVTGRNNTYNGGGGGGVSSIRTSLLSNGRPNFAVVSGVTLHAREVSTSGNPGNGSGFISVCALNVYSDHGRVIGNISVAAASDEVARFFFSSFPPPSVFGEIGRRRFNCIIFSSHW